ncbi:SEC-C metal-binding domain-containing protein [Luteimonas fraxinea]|uniref:SEC-C metal-binding domain-containing protein n=1 Tax=Luteimonas fraxinea TaxID=2901869 RepID=UPI001E5873B7|nr:SEC-C metal-binding domain-containing protein [Luteimonas fraxinea]MCD9125775.1 SEC-C domain-containing protein [Luteimonas fraxinea]
MKLEPTEKSAGTTDSEKQLSELCDKTFLKLWSYPNLYTDEGLSRNNQGKELCDLLCVFGGEVIIFSDKFISFSNCDISIAWPRWFRRSIESSCRQIIGAEKWIREQGHRIFLDKRCIHQFPLEIMNSGLRIHRVVVARNSKEVAENYFGGGSSGSLIVRSDLKGKDHYNYPFHVGMPLENGPYFHVLDDVSLHLILGELDTVSDLVDYLNLKEKAATSGQLRSAAGEEEILAFYMRSRKGAKNNLNLIPSSVRRKFPGGVALVEGLWQELSESEEFREEKELSQVSYYWDELLQRIANHIILGDAIGSHSVVDHEKVLRLFAAENRASRTILGWNTYEKYLQVPPDMRSARVVLSPSDKEKAFIFLFFPRGEDQNYEEYRNERQSAATAYAHTLKLISPEFRYICVIATEPQSSIGRSEDFMAFDIQVLSSEEKARIRDMQSEYEIFTNTLPRGPAQVGSGRQRPQRNSPCPCGSGKKFKKCCG